MAKSRDSRLFLVIVVFFSLVIKTHKTGFCNRLFGRYICMFRLLSLPLLFVDQFGFPPQFGQIPWGHHICILTNSKTVEEALFYMNKTIEGNWSRRMLEDNMEADLYGRQAKAVTNFGQHLPTFLRYCCRQIAARRRRQPKHRPTHLPVEGRHGSGMVFTGHQ